MKTQCIYLLILFLLASCSGKTLTKAWIPGTCLTEVNKTYVGGLSPKGNIYKIDQIIKHESKYQVSIYNLGGWQYLKRKPASYFNESKNFLFQEVECPDGSTKLGLKHRLKGFGKTN